MTLLGQSESGTISVPVDDLALSLYLDDGLLAERAKSKYSRTCGTCGGAAGAHWCGPREAARNRLEKLVKEAKGL